MIYSQIKTGKVQYATHTKYPIEAAKRDIEFLQKVVSHPGTAVFSIPELATPDVPELQSMHDFIMDTYHKSGLSLMPPYEVTWWEAPIYWRYIDFNNVNPGVMVAVYAGREAQTVEIDRRLLKLLDEHGWHAMVCIMPSFVYERKLSPMCSHLFIGIDKAGYLQGLIIRTPEDEGYFKQIAKAYCVENNLPINSIMIDDIQYTLADTAVGACLPVLKALALLNCKNISTDEHHFHMPRRKKGKRKPMARAVYRTLKLIVPGKRTQHQHKPAEDDPDGRAFHMVRGHFAIYTEEHGLFGKYPGRYWIPAHTRGSKDMGIVKKNYELEVTK